MDHVVLDIEIQRNPEEVPGGWDATDKLGVACAGLYEFRHQRFRIYGPDDVPALQERLLAADRISGFNIWRFDFPVVWGLPRLVRGTSPPQIAATIEMLRAKTNDVLLRIWHALGLPLDQFTDRHQGWGLHYMALGILGRGKTGYGGDAPKWYQAGQWAKVVDYCLSDLALTRDVVAFLDKYGWVRNGKTGAALEVPALDPARLP